MSCFDAGPPVVPGAASLWRRVLTPSFDRIVFEKASLRWDSIRSSAYSRSLSTCRRERLGSKLPNTVPDPDAVSAITGGVLGPGTDVAGAGALGELNTCLGRGACRVDDAVCGGACCCGACCCEARGGEGVVLGALRGLPLVFFSCCRFARRSAAWRRKSSKLSIMAFPL